jgi:3-hydroxyisobutyrate dehydrogenase-like beta-hydroxyacid dehydrogenase
MMNDKLPIIGWIGLGEMGAPITRNLVAKGAVVFGYDLDPGRLAASAADGVQAVDSITALLSVCEVIFTSLPSSEILLRVAEYDILPHVRPGQIVVDTGTVIPAETRRLAARFAERGVPLIDSPLSGGAYGAQRSDLFMFVGGDPVVYEEIRPILVMIGGPDRITYCGPAGAGQVVKGVNQLMMGLANAAYLEAVAFGVRAGVEADILEKALGSEGRLRGDFHAIASEVAHGDPLGVGVKFRELPYFLQEARLTGFDMPLTDVLYQYLADKVRVTMDDHRLAPSFWHELTRSDTEQSR